MTSVSRRAALAIAGLGILPASVLKAQPLTGSLAKPNILLIVADDLGYSDLGAFGGEIHTPNLDSLARSGTRLTNFHATAGCASTRAMLMAGIDHHLTGLGTFPELLDEAQRGKPGYEGNLVANALCVAEPLREAGYRTMIAGKWHLGNAASADPSVRGFDRSFILVGGGASHFGTRTDGKPGIDVEYRENGNRLTELPPNFYSTDAYVSKLIEYLRETPDRQPFFAYLPVTAPHYPLQVPPEDMPLYRGRYDAGWGKLFVERTEGMKREGVLPSGADVDPAPHEEAWNALSAPERALAARKMEVYAAMIDRLDRNVGRLTAELKAMKRYDDTIIVFLSDNGPEGTELDKSERHAAMGKAILQQADNSLDSIGGPRSYVWYGPGWAHVSAAPFRMFKHLPTEGGIRVPAFVAAAGHEQIARSDAFGLVNDITRTLVDWGHARMADPGRGELPYTGHSLAALLAGGNAAYAVASVGWELWGRRAFRSGRWKAFLIPDAMGSGRWELYDVESDPSETHDLANVRPELLASLVRGWNEYAQHNGVVLPSVPGL